MTKIDDSKLPTSVLTKSVTKAKRVNERPPEPFFFGSLGGSHFAQEGSVNLIVAEGGTGKSLFSVQAAGALAGDSKCLPCLGVEKPVETLYLGFEDPLPELDRRLWNIFKGSPPEGLHAFSVVGQVPPLMYLDGNKPKRSVTWQWLNRSLEEHEGVKVLFLDPKSRFYGLDENNNDHAAQWMASLEALAQIHEIAIVVCHHVPKGANRLHQAMSRGASALGDAARSMIVMSELDEEGYAKFGITTDAGSFVEVRMVKNNYASKSDKSLFFQRGENGVLRWTNLYNIKISSMAPHFLFVLNQSANLGKFFSRRELRRDPVANDLMDKMAAACKEFTRNIDVPPLIDFLLGEGLVREMPSKTSSQKKVIVPFVESGGK